MLFNFKKDLKDIIIENLTNEGLDVVKLSEIAVKEGFSVQGFYKSLRVLIKNQVVIKNKKMLNLNPLWIKKIEGFVNKIKSKSSEKFTKEVISLEDGDVISHSFKDMGSMQDFWGYYFYNFCQTTTGPIITYNPHNFWFLIDSEIESQIYLWSKQGLREVYSVSDYKTPLDKYIEKGMFENFKIQTSYLETPEDKIKPLFKTVFQDYIITTYLEKSYFKKIHNLFLKYSTMNENLKQEVATLVRGVNYCKVKVERNAKSAETLRRKLLKGFIFYK